MMLSHVGYRDESKRLEDALEAADKELGPRMTGMAGGATCREYSRISHIEVIMVQNFWICINAVVPLMIYLIIGMLVKRVGLINDDEVHRFNRLVFIVLFPPMMFETSMGEVKHSFEPKTYSICTCISFILHSA